MRIENQLFPECIQASAKYYNKRRSSNIRTSDDKENLFSSFYAGEELNKSYSTTMNTRINLVQKWLEKNEKVERPIRKPFSDVNVNNSFRSNTENKIKKGLKAHNQENNLNKKSKKVNKDKNISKTKKKSKIVSSPSLLDYYKNETIKNKAKPENILNFDKKYDISPKVVTDNKYENNTDVEYIDTIVIEDTQSQVVDKDRDAWLKVVEEHNKESNDFKDKLKSSERIPLSETQLELIPHSVNNEKNVIYYKKAYLFKSCHSCLRNDVESVHCSCENQRLNSNISITINTNSISSTIKVLRDDENFNSKVIKHTIETQTEDFNHISPSYENISSPDLFLDDVKKLEDIDKENLNDKDIGIIDNSISHNINDSDSDDMECSGPIKVSVDVHRSNDT